jgi:hypothetical protein
VPAADDIFPTTGHHDFVQTQWSEGWAYAVIGFGSAARMLTEQRAKMHASVDQIGLAVFYLQRHRVELVIKQALVDLGQDEVDVAKLPHNLAVLWQKLRDVVSAIGGDHWRDLDSRYGDFVSTMHEADEGSFSYRYPVDRQGAEAKRAPFIDLDQLQEYAEGFEMGIGAYTDWIDEGERMAREYNQP